MLYQLSYSRMGCAERTPRGGQGWIQTSEGIRQRFYRPSPLAARAPAHALLLEPPRGVEPPTPDYKSGALPVELGWQDGGWDPVRGFRLAHPPESVKIRACASYLLGRPGRSREAPTSSSPGAGASFWTAGCSKGRRRPGTTPPSALTLRRWTPSSSPTPTWTTWGGCPSSSAKATGAPFTPPGPRSSSWRSSWRTPSR